MTNFWSLTQIIYLTELYLLEVGIYHLNLHISLARSGAKVTILHRGKQPLEHFDPDLVNLLVKRSRDIGIDIQLQRVVTKVERLSEDKLIVHSSNLADRSDTDSKILRTIEAGLVVHGAGREPNVEVPGSRCRWNRAY